MAGHLQLTFIDDDDILGDAGPALTPSFSITQPQPAGASGVSSAAAAHARPVPDLDDSQREPAAAFQYSLSTFSQPDVSRPISPVLPASSLGGSVRGREPTQPLPFPAPSTLTAPSPKRPRAVPAYTAGNALLEGTLSLPSQPFMPPPPPRTSPPRAGTAAAVPSPASARQPPASQGSGHVSEIVQQQVSIQASAGVLEFGAASPQQPGIQASSGATPPRDAGAGGQTKTHIPGPAGAFFRGGGDADTSGLPSGHADADDTSASAFPANPAVPEGGEPTSGIYGPGQRVDAAWLSTGAWRTLAIDLDLPPEATPWGRVEGAAAPTLSNAPAVPSTVVPLRTFTVRAAENPRMCWKGVPGVGVVITAYRATAAGALATVQDWSGSARALLARDVVQDFGSRLGVGSCLSLAGVAVIQPSPGVLYLNVLSDTVSKVYASDTRQPAPRHTQQQSQSGSG